MKLDHPSDVCFKHSAIEALPDDLDVRHEHPSVELEGGGNYVFVGSVVAAPDRAELDPWNAGALEVDDVAGAVAADAHWVAVVVALGYLAQDLYVWVRVGDVGRLAAEQDLHLCWQVEGADLAHYLVRVLVRQEADVEVVGAAVGDAIEDVTSDDTRQVHAGVWE